MDLAKYSTLFWDWLDKRAIVRRIAFFLVLYMTWDAFYWTIHFADTSTKPGTEIGVIIAAVWAPLTALQAAVFALYANFRMKGPANAVDS